MKKNIRHVAIIVMLLLVFAGCSANPDSSSLPLESSSVSSPSESSMASEASMASVSNVSSTPTSSMEDDILQLNQTLEKTIDHLAMAGILSHSWESGNDIDPFFLQDYYCFDFLLYEYPDGWTSPLYVPEGECEEYLQNAFDVSVEHLRTGKYYHADKQSYEFRYGFGSGPGTEILETVEDGDVIAVKFQLYNPADEPTLNGILKMKQEDSGLKFLSCTSQKNE